MPPDDADEDEVDADARARRPAMSEPMAPEPTMVIRTPLFLVPGASRPWPRPHLLVPLSDRFVSYCRTTSHHHHAPVGTDLVSVRSPHQIRARTFGPCWPASTHYSSLISTLCFFAAHVVRFLIFSTSSRSYLAAL